MVQEISFHKVKLLKPKDAVSEQWRTKDFFLEGGRGIQQIQLRTEDRENGDLGAVAP